MLPVFVGLFIWLLLMAVALLGGFLLFKPLRPFAGFVFLTPIFGISGALIGFAIIGSVLDGRMDAAVATSLAFYLGFLICGAIGTVLGFGSGFLVWRRVRSKRKAAQLVAVPQ